MTDTLAPPSPTSTPAGPPPAIDGSSESRLRPRQVDRRELGVVAGCATSAFCATWLVYERLTPLSGGLGFWLCWYVVFVALTWLVARDLAGAEAAKDRLATVVVTTAGLALLLPLVLIVGYTVYRGWGALRPHFFVETQELTGPLSPADEGGAAHAIVGTLQQVGLAVIMSVPLGVTTAVFLNEIGGRLAHPVRLIVDAMSAVPSVVAGLFIYAVLVPTTGFSGFAAALALSVLMLPTVTRTAEVVLRLVPGGLREGALALGGTEWRMARLVILPTARTGLITAVILGVARAVGETAPLLFTTGGNVSMNLNPFSGQQEALPLFVYKQIFSSSDTSVARAWTGAFVLLVLVLALFVAARALGGRAPGQAAAARTRILRRKVTAP